MPMISRIDWEAAEKMRGEGRTFRVIAEHFGVSKQCVESGLARRKMKRRKHADLFESIPYDGLRRWVEKDERLTLGKLAMITFGNQNPEAKAKLTRMFNGQDVRLTVRSINNLCEASGMTFEELFAPIKKVVDNKESA